MATTVCPICNHPTRYPRSNPNAWECTFCGTSGLSTENLRLDAYSVSVPYIDEPSSFTVVNKPGGLKYDSGKLCYDLVPPATIKAIAEVLTFGAKKYAPNAWQTVTDGETRYIAALMRHFEAYRAGEDFDLESGKSHLAHCLCNLAFLLHFQQTHISGT